MARTPVVLKDVPSNPSEAMVDDVTLVKGVPSELTKEQIDRLQSTTGVKLETGQAAKASEGEGS